MTITGAQLRIAHKNPCRLATTGNVALSGLSAIDGVTPVAGDRILAWMQTNAALNGIYIAASTGWSRAEDFDESNDDRITAGLQVYIQEGVAYQGHTFKLTTTGSITLGSTAIGFTDVTALGSNWRGSVLVPEQLYDGGATIYVRQATGLSLTGQPAAANSFTITNGTTTETWTFQTGTETAAFQVQIGGSVALTLQALAAAISADSTLWDAVYYTANVLSTNGIVVIYRTSPLESADRIYGTFTGSVGKYVSLFGETDYRIAQDAFFLKNVPTTDPGFKTFGYGIDDSSYIIPGDTFVCILNQQLYAANTALDGWVRVDGSSAGDVTGPSSSIDNALVRFDLTTGKIIQGGTVTNNVILDDTGNLSPETNGGGDLGTTGSRWATLHLNTTGVINWNAGDVTITHAINALTFAGATSGYTFSDGTIRAPDGTAAAPGYAFSGASSTGMFRSGSLLLWSIAGTGEIYLSSTALSPFANDGSALGNTTNQWSDLFLASGGVINFDNGDVTITHAANGLAFAGASASGYAFDYSLFLTERAAALADVAGLGQIWVRTDTPNELWFTDDLGRDHRLEFREGQTVYVSSETGKAAYSGLMPTQPKATLADAITVAVAQTPSSSNHITIFILDSSTYTEDPTIPQYVSLIGPTAKISGSLVVQGNPTNHSGTVHLREVSDNSAVLIDVTGWRTLIIDSLIQAGGFGLRLTSGTTNFAHVQFGKIDMTAATTTYGVEVVDGFLYGHIGEIETNGPGSAIRINSSSSGRIYGLKVDHIICYHASGNAILHENAQDSSIYAGEINSSGTTYSVTNASGDLYLFAGRITGTTGTLTGTAHVTLAGADVVGPASSVAGAIARFSDTTGKVLDDGIAGFEIKQLGATGDLFPSSTSTALGTTTWGWRDIYIADTGSLSFGPFGSKVNITHSTGTLTFNGATTGGYIFDEPLFLTERAAALADVAGKGQVWVKNATPNELWFTDDAGTDWQLNTAGGGDVTGPGSSIDNALVRFDLTTGKIIQGGAASNNVILSDTGDLYPEVSDGGALGTTSFMWSDLFLATGGVINWNAGDVTITHSANTLAFAGATSGYTFSNGNVTVPSLVAGTPTTSTLGVTTGAFAAAILKERAASVAAAVDEGEFWVLSTDNPNLPMFRNSDGSGYERNLAPYMIERTVLHANQLTSFTGQLYVRQAGVFFFNAGSANAAAADTFTLTDGTTTETWTFQTGAETAAFQVQIGAGTADTSAALAAAISADSTKWLAVHVASGTYPLSSTAGAVIIYEAGQLQTDDRMYGSFASASPRYINFGGSYDYSQGHSNGRADTLPSSDPAAKTFGWGGAVGNFTAYTTSGIHGKLFSVLYPPAIYAANQGTAAGETWSSVGGSIGGTTGSTDNALLRADGTGGATIQASPVTVADTTGDMTFPNNAKILWGAANSWIEADGTTSTGDVIIHSADQIVFEVAGSGTNKFVMLDTGLAVKEQTAAPTGVPTYGVFWVKDDVPSIPAFTDDTNVSYNLLNWSPTKRPCRIATTANHGLSGLAAIDGITPIAGNRILVWNQTTASANGIYVAAAGAWSRAPDFDNASADHIEAGVDVYVQEGNTWGGIWFTLTTTGTITIGSTSLTFNPEGGLARTDATSTEVIASTAFTSGTFVTSSAIDMRDHSAIAVFFNPTTLGSNTQVDIVIFWSDDGSTIPFATDDNIQQSDFDIVNQTDGTWNPKPYTARLTTGGGELAANQKMHFTFPKAGGSCKIGVKGNDASGTFDVRVQRLTV